MTPLSGLTSMAYDQWESKIHHWLLKSIRHSLPLLPQASIVLCQPEPQPSLQSHQRLVELLRYNVTAIWETLSRRMIMHTQMSFAVLTSLSVYPHERFSPNKYITFSAKFLEGSSELAWNQHWHNLPTISSGVMKTVWIASRTWWNIKQTLILILLVAVLP